LWSDKYAAAVRSAVVTGASTGIGRTTALGLDAQGWRVFAGVRRKEDGEALQKAGSGRIEPLMLDVTDAEQIADAARRVGEKVGSEGLHGLVNNAGIALGGPIEALAIEDLRAVLETNVIGQVAVTQAFLPLVRDARGRVVFVGSVNGRLSLPFLSPYTASKHAIEAIGDSLRGEMRPFGVKVSIVEPGAIETPMREKGSAAAHKVKVELSASQLRIYGKAIDGFIAGAAKADEQASSPEKVAAAIEHALTANRPRTRYLVGPDARAQALLASLLPDRVGDRVIAFLMRG
jgi:NAD(P)-dependent dehydrogenase (short-subunit alcohol dehydrogenase family)